MQLVVGELDSTPCYTTSFQSVVAGYQSTTRGGAPIETPTACTVPTGCRDKALQSNTVLRYALNPIAFATMYNQAR